jgi:hypothetical protein
MISDLQKNDIFNNTKYFYTSIRFNEANLKLTFERDYRSNEEFKKALFNENTRIFFRHVVTLKGEDFLNTIKNEFKLFSTYNNPDEFQIMDWLTFTFNYIVKPNQLSGFINKTDVVGFVKWHNKKVQKHKPISKPYSENIELYKKVTKDYFIENCINNKNEDGTNNKLYYNNFLQKDFIAGLNDIDTNEAYTLFKDKAKEYIRTEKSLKTNIIKYLIWCKKDQIAGIQHHWYEIEDNFISIKDFIRAIEYYKVTNDTLKAIELKRFIVSKLKLIVRDLEFLNIYLTETPIEAKIINLIAEFERSIDNNEIHLIEALKKQPQQVESVKTDEVIKELRNDIFKGNAIELFKYYYECKSMVNNSRVHFRFLFEVMKEDGFIHDTVTLGQYIKFITKDFGYVDTELKSIDLNSKPNKNNLKDYNRYKEDLKTTLK